mgnify:CR=1 FL=1
MELLEGGGAEHGLVVDQDAARLAIATCLDLKDPESPMKDEMYNAFTPHATNLAVEGVSFPKPPSIKRYISSSKNTARFM